MIYIGVLFFLGIFIGFLLDLYIRKFSKPRIQVNLIFSSLARFIFPVCLAVVFIIFSFLFDTYYTLFKFIALISLLIPLMVLDFKLYILPDFLTFSLIALGVVLSLYEKHFIQSIFHGFIGALTFLFILWIGYIFYKKPVIGAGDIKLIFGLGLFLTLHEILLVIKYSFITAGICGFLLICFKIKSKYDIIPFGPFIIFTFLFIIILDKTRLW